MIEKQFMCNFLHLKDGKSYRQFSDLLLKNISEIDNDESVQKIKYEHSAIEHIKNEAKKINKKSKIGLVNAQNQLTHHLFGKNNLSEVYEDIEKDIHDTLLKNEHFHYDKEKPDGMVMYGKNHIGFYLMKDISQTLYHMAFFKSDKIIDEIKKHHQVYPQEFLDYVKTDFNQGCAKFILVDDLKTANPTKIHTLLQQGRSQGIFLIFKFNDDTEILNFLQQDYRANLHDVCYDRPLYEKLFGFLDANRVAVNHILESGQQLEFLVNNLQKVSKLTNL